MGRKGEGYTIAEFDDTATRSAFIDSLKSAGKNIDGGIRNDSFVCGLLAFFVAANVPRLVARLFAKEVGKQQNAKSHTADRPDLLVQEK